jgi:hypothetical protein
LNPDSIDHSAAPDKSRISRDVISQVGHWEKDIAKALTPVSDVTFSAEPRLPLDRRKQCTSRLEGRMLSCQSAGRVDTHVEGG